MTRNRILVTQGNVETVIQKAVWKIKKRMLMIFYLNKNNVQWRHEQHPFSFNLYSRFSFCRKRQNYNWLAPGRTRGLWILFCSQFISNIKKWRKYPPAHKMQLFIVLWNLMMLRSECNWFIIHTKVKNDDLTTLKHENLGLLNSRSFLC